MAPGSHRNRRGLECRKVLVKDGTDSVDGDGSGPPRFCNLEKLSPKCHAWLERSKRVYDLEPGDAIFMHRYVFQRTDPVHLGPVEAGGSTAAGGKAATKVAGRGLFGRRKKARRPPVLQYSLRYVPASAKIYDNGIERAIRVKRLKTGDPVSGGGEFYPQVWPNGILAERIARDRGVVQRENRLASLTLWWRVVRAWCKGIQH